MTEPISLRGLVNEMEGQPAGSRVYLNKLTGEYVMVSQEDIDWLDNGLDWGELPDWQQESLHEVEAALESDDYLCIPDNFEIHEYQIMKNFSLSYADGSISDDLLDQISGSGAFRNFKRAIRRYGIEDEWYDFKAIAYQEIAKAWLEENDLAYSDDTGGTDQ
jgi:hypothetical protein